ncbi:glycosyltransferase family 4 protein [Candidatus Sumerlaeota bacterium]|nr:glycosyltransferase family 4 protein [Candidatus Sumerlaeota bacterium]
MRLVLNAMQVRAAKSGVGQYIYALTEELLPLLKSDDHLSLYTSRENCGNYQFADAPPNYENIPWGFPEGKKIRRLLKEYLCFPREAARQHHPTLLHGLSNFLPFYKVCPYVLSLHDLSYYVHPERCGTLRRAYWYAMTARSVAVADEIITISENSRRDILHYFPDCKAPVTVIPLAAHRRFRVLDLPRERCMSVGAYAGSLPYILYVGTLEPGKNVGRIIRAFDALADRFPEHLLLLAGDKGWLTDSIFAEAERASHRQRIKFLGHVSDDAVVELMNHTDVFVFPSLYEGFGMPPLEAMSCGAPVVTSLTSSLPEVTGPDAALQVDPLDEADLTSKLCMVLSDCALSSRLREKGMARAAEFSWSKTAKETYTVYERTSKSGSQ